MALPVYLAMTAFEYEHCPSPPKNPGWMACHFSSYGEGLSNIPQQFPQGGIVMVNDQIPPACHSSDLIVQQLLQTVENFSPRAIVLDFQRPFQQLLRDIAQEILSDLPCPVVLTESYCKDWSGGVLLPPAAPHKPIEEHLRPWQGKDIWLEISKAGESLLLTESGCQMQSLTELPGETVFRNEKLFCHYSTQVTDCQAVFSLWRTDKDLEQLLDAAENLAVTAAVGLYQEFS